MAHGDLVAFLRRAKAALRPHLGEGAAPLIVVKENCCEDADRRASEFLDEEDSSLTR